jgi:hypothetical protein
MGDILAFKIPRPSERHRGKTLCKRGFHQWEIVNEKRFDVRQGKLVTVSQCKRCGKQKNEAR